MEFQGRIQKLLPIRTGKKQDGSEWQSQEFVFEYYERDSDRWSDKVVLTLMGDRIKEADLHEGDEVKIGFGHSVREWNGRWFNELRVYKLEKVSKTMQSAQETQAAPSTATDDEPF